MRGIGVLVRQYAEWNKLKKCWREGIKDSQTLPDIIFFASLKGEMCIRKLVSKPKRKE